VAENHAPIMGVMGIMVVMEKMGVIEKMRVMRVKRSRLLLSLFSYVSQNDVSMIKKTANPAWPFLVPLS